MKIFRPVEYGDNLMCACGDETCYKAISLGPDNLVLETDINDPRDSETFVFDLPKDVTLCRAINVDEAVSDVDLLQLCIRSSQLLTKEQGEAAGKDPHKVVAASMMALRELYEQRLGALRGEYENRIALNRQLQEELGKQTKANIKLHQEVESLRAQQERLELELVRTKRGVR